MTEAIFPQNQPDILEVIASLSNEQVFTPPRVANAVLDLLPPEVWTNPNLRWLDPGCKTGIFPREMTKRLMVGLVEAFPDEKLRLEHILKNMIFAVATEELTSLMARRTLYCSKDASSEHSSVRMSSRDGNVWLKRVEHNFTNGRCSECGASKDQMERENRENYAYGFIHATGRESIKKEIGMKFDVIVGNPPYQMTGGGGGVNDTAIYNLFVEQAKALNPKYLSMIIPSRWMSSGRGLEEFRDEMLSDRRIRVIVDFPDAEELFPGTPPKGGVCYFLWNRDETGDCDVTVKRGNQTHGPVKRNLDEYDVFVRDSRGLSILRKVLKLKEPLMDAIASADTPFGFASNFNDFRLTGKRRNDISIFAVQKMKRVVGYLDRSVVFKNSGAIDSWKVFLPLAGSDPRDIPDQVIGKAEVAPPPSICTQTYRYFGPFIDQNEATNFAIYLRTRFARFMISLRKNSHNTYGHTFAWVPLQDFSKPITDAELFKKYGITKDEQAYISELIKEMP